MPRRYLTSGRKFSTSTSDCSTSLNRIALPRSSFRLRVMLRLLGWMFWKSYSWRAPVPSSSVSSASTLMTWAPISLSWRTQVGPDRARARSMTLMCDRGIGPVQGYPVRAYVIPSLRGVPLQPASSWTKRRICLRMRRLRRSLGFLRFVRGQAPARLRMTHSGAAAGLLGGLLRRVSGDPCPGLGDHLRGGHCLGVQHRFVPSSGSEVDQYGARRGWANVGKVQYFQKRVTVSRLASRRVQISTPALSRVAWNRLLAGGLLHGLLH